MVGMGLLGCQRPQLPKQQENWADIKKLLHELHWTNHVKGRVPEDPRMEHPAVNLYY
jgi:hypothetical protein